MFRKPPRLVCNRGFMRNRVVTQLCFAAIVFLTEPARTSARARAGTRDFINITNKSIIPYRARKEKRFSKVWQNIFSPARFQPLFAPFTARRVRFGKFFIFEKRPVRRRKNVIRSTDRSEPFRMVSPLSAHTVSGGTIMKSAKNSSHKTRAMTEEERARAKAAVYAAAGACLAAGSIPCTVSVAPFLGGSTRGNFR